MSVLSPHELGQRIREYREEADQTQAELAEALGIPRSAISLVESGDRRVHADELIAISQALNVTVNTLLALEERPTDYDRGYQDGYDAAVKRIRKALDAP